MIMQEVPMPVGDSDDDDDPADEVPVPVGDSDQETAPESFEQAACNERWVQSRIEASGKLSEHIVEFV